MKKQLFTLIFIPLLINTLHAQITPSIEWQKCLGGTNNEAAFSVQQTSDGGFIAAGYSDSNDGDVSGNNGSSDYWIVKLDATSNLDWQESLGGSSIDQANAIKQTSDGGFIVAGYSYSTNDDVTGNHGSSDYWIVKLGTTGDLIWQKTFGGSSDDGANSIQQTADGGYIVSGYSESNDGDVSGNNGARDNWIVRLDTGGDLVWQTHLGSSGYDEAWAVLQTTTGFIVSGFAGSNDFDVSGNHGGYDYWIVKLDSAGSLISQSCFGGTNTDQSFSLSPTSDGGFVASGQSLSSNGDVSDAHGGYDFWVIKIDADANLEWEKSMGGTSDDYGPYGIQQTTDGGFIIGGSSLSNDVDVSGNHGGFVYGDCWIVKLAGGKATGIASSANNLFSIYPNPVQAQLNIDLSAASGEIIIQVYDVQGKIISLPITIANMQAQLNTWDLAEGLYTLKILDTKTGEQEVGKFVKSK